MMFQPDVIISDLQSHLNLVLLDSWLIHLNTKTLFFPGCLLAVVDDIPCMFQGHIENVAHLKQQYGLNKTANEVIIVIEAYRTLRDRGPYPPDQVVKDIHGKFAFVLYDSASKSTFLADVDGSVPFFWGTNSEGHLVLSDDADIVQQGCGKSFAPFPKEFLMMIVLVAVPFHIFWWLEEL